MKTLSEQITETRKSLSSAKPRSNLRLKLELRLRDLMTRKLKQEMRAA